jgi:RHS repeat-associated protein
MSYLYDNVGNVTQITDLFTAGRDFTYDALNRSITGSGTFGPNQSTQNCTYEYDSIGNMTNKCGAALEYNYSGHPSAVSRNVATGKTYEYDDNGSMTRRDTQTLTWDVDNRLVKIEGGGTTIMEYDSTGQRVIKNGPTGITLFPFDGIEIANGVITKYIKIGGEIFAAKKQTNLTFYHNDHLEGVNIITNTDVNNPRCQLDEYDPSGAVSREEGNCDPTHRFTGQELDPETGIYYYGGRYYDEEIGRFISPDPFVPAPDDPQNLNRYSYALNNPQRYTDPTGYQGDVGGPSVVFAVAQIIRVIVFNFIDTPHHEFKVVVKSFRSPANHARPENSGGPTSDSVSRYADEPGKDIPDDIIDPTGEFVRSEQLLKNLETDKRAPKCTGEQSSGKKSVISANLTTNRPFIAAGIILGGIIADVPGAIVGGILGSNIGIGPNISVVPSTSSVYVGATVLAAPFQYKGGNSYGINEVKVPPSQNPNAIANGLSGSVTFQPLPFLGSTATYSPGSGPTVFGLSVGSRSVYSGNISYNVCLINCGCSR